jgi:hypothetical protein
LNLQVNPRLLLLCLLLHHHLFAVHLSLFIQINQVEGILQKRDPQGQLLKQRVARVLPLLTGPHPEYLWKPQRKISLEVQLSRMEVFFQGE